MLQRTFAQKKMKWFATFSCDAQRVKNGRRKVDLFSIEINTKKYDA
jgi:hypothetical protein